MKRILIAILAITPVLYFSACKKKYTTDNVTERIVEPHYPTITLNGEQFISVPVGGGSYTDAGASGLDDNTGISTVLTPEPYNVDLSTPGFYTVIYKFRNTDGYFTDKTRFILVSDIADSLDYSGEYVRTNGVPTNVSKVARALYKTDNVGGVGTPGTPNPAFIDDVYFGQIDDTTLVFPVQPTIFGSLYCDNSFIRASASDTVMSYIVRRDGVFGTAVRTFIKDDDGL